MTVLIVIGLWLTASVLVSLLIGRAISVMGEDAIVTSEHLELALGAGEHRAATCSNSKCQK